MRVLVDPQRVELTESHQFAVQITVTNTGDVIGGYQLRVLGADPQWVDLEKDELSLFPGTFETVVATIDLPRGVGAGDRRIAIQVREATPPHAMSVTEIELLVPPSEAIQMALSPTTVTCGKRGRFSVVSENTGNTSISVAPVGMDPEDQMRFNFVPQIIELAPGEHIITDLRASAKRRWFGSPAIRPFSLAAIAPDELDEFLALHDPKTRKKAKKAAAKQKKRDRRRQRKRDRELMRALERDPYAADTLVTEPVAAPAEPPAEPPEELVQGVMVQKPKLGRGVLSLLSLLLAISVFAVVITIAMSRLVGVSAADRDLAIQVASARTDGAGVGTSVIGGIVKRVTDGSVVPGVTVEVFTAGDLTQPMISTATDDNGQWVVEAMPAGSYKARFRSAGFAEVWHPNALTSSDAEDVVLAEGDQVTDLAVTLGGLPATISGEVTGDDVAGAIVTVQVPQEFLAPADDDSGGDGSEGDNLDAELVEPANEPDDGSLTGGVLRTIPIGSDGLFTLESLPSPAVYDLVVTKIGYSSDMQRVDLSGGESRSGVKLLLRTGDGLISGSVMGPEGPLGGAVVTAASGDTTVRTLTLTGDNEGAFTLRGLVTPAVYTVSISAADFTTVTTTLALSSGQKITDVIMSLAQSAGTLSGMVTTVIDGLPATGVGISIASSSTEEINTVTQSGDTAGAWTVSGLKIPGTYTLTFSRDDLQSQTVAVSLNAAGGVTSGASADDAVSVAMRSAFASVTGVIRQQTPAGNEPVGEATITLSSGENQYTVSSASIPSDIVGHFEISHIVPGTYTAAISRKGTSPTTVIISVTSGQILNYNPQLVQAASVGGIVTGGGTPLVGLEVNMYLATEYPAKVYAQTITDAAGKYSFTDVDAPQAYVVEVREPNGNARGSDTVVLEASQAQVLNLAVPDLTNPGGTP